MPAVDDPLQALRGILGKKKSFSEKIDEQLGKLLFLYYRYVYSFHRTPIDFDDIIDGIIYLSLEHGEKDG